MPIRHRIGDIRFSKYLSMNQYEVPAFIVEQFPETNNHIVYQATIGNVYQTMTVFSQFMHKKVISHQFSKVFKCLQMAGFIYEHGNQEVKNAVENEFIYSFSRASQSCSKKEWEVIKAHIPAILYTIYIKQIIGYGC